jgi:hypothetical protein
VSVQLVHPERQGVLLGYGRQVCLRVRHWARSRRQIVVPSLPVVTIQTYISRILTKLGAKGRVEIVREALRQGVSP